MSSVLKDSVIGGPLSKVVLHERNKSTMGTNYVSSKTRIAIKRNLASKEKSNDNDTSTSSNKLGKIDKVAARSKKPSYSSENNRRKNVLNEKRSKSTNVKAEEGKLEKHVLNDNATLKSCELTVSVNSHDTVTDENIIKEDERITENISHSEVEVTGIIKSSQTNSVRSSEIAKAQSRDTSQSNAKSDLTSLAHKTCNGGHTEMAEQQNNQNNSTEKTGELSPPVSVVTKSKPISTQCLSKTESLTKNRTLNKDSKIKTVISVKSRSFIPKPQSVILDSCDLKQLDFELPDANKDTICSSNTSGQIRPVCKTESDADHNEDAVKLTRKTPDKCISSINACIKPTTIPTNGKFSVQNTNTERKNTKSSHPESIPSYQRMTSSAANKDIKMNADKARISKSKQRSLAQEYHSKSIVNQGHKSKSDFSRTESKNDNSKKDWPSGLRSSVNAIQTTRNSVSTTAPCDKSNRPAETDAIKSDSSSTEDTILTPEYNQNTSYECKMTDEEEIEAHNSNRDSDIPVHSSRPVERISKSVIEVQNTSCPNDIKSENIQKAKVPIKEGRKMTSQSLIPKSSSASANKVKGVSTSMSVTRKRAGIDNSAGSISKPKTLRLKQVNAQQECATASGPNTRARSLTPCDLKPLNSKRQISQDKTTGSRSRSTTPGVSSVSSSDSSHCRSSESEHKKARGLNQQNSQNGENMKESISSVTSDNTNSTESTLKSKSSHFEQLDSKEKPDMKSISNPKLRSQTSGTQKSEKSQSANRNISPRSQSTAPGTTSLLADRNTDRKQDLKSRNAQRDKPLKKDSNSRLRSNTSELSVAVSYNNKSGAQKTTQALKEHSRGNQTVRRDSDSRSRSTTPGAPSTSSSGPQIQTSACDQAMTDKTVALKRVSKSRSCTPDAPATVSGKNTYSKGNSKQTKCSLKQDVSQKEIDSNFTISRSSSTTSSNNFCNGGSKSSSKQSFKQNVSQTEQTACTDSNSRSRSTTPGAVSTSSGSSVSDSSIKSSSRQTMSSLKQTISPRDKSLNGNKPSRLKSIPSSSRSFHNTKTSTTNRLKQPNSQLELKETRHSVLGTRPVASATSCNSSDLSLKLVSKPATLRRQDSKGDLKSDRKSRSRSSTPDASTLPPGRNSCNNAFLKHKAASKQNSQSDQIKLRSKIPKEIPVLTRNCSGDKVSRHLESRKPEGTTDSTSRLTSTVSDRKRNSTEAKTDEQSDSNETTQMFYMKTKTAFSPKRNDNKSQNLDNTETDDKQKPKHHISSNQVHRLQGKTNGILISEKGRATIEQTSTKSKARESKSASALSSVTKSNSQLQVTASCSSFTTVSNFAGNTRQGNKHSELLGSHNICGNKTQVLSPAENDKLIEKSTKLSIKPDSRIKAGKIHTLVKNKKSNSLQTSSENRSRLQRGDRSFQKKVNKTLVSDNKSRKTASLSVIKRDGISTKPCNKSEKEETCKQNSQLPGNLTLSIANFELETQGVYIADELIGVDTCLIKDENELVDICGSDLLNTGKNEISNMHRTDRITSEITDDEKSNSIDFNLDRSDYHTNVNHLLENSMCSSEIKDRMYSEENEHSGKNDNIGCIALISGKHKFPSNALCIDINSIDRETTTHDPNTKVSSNCLSDVREIEIERVNCETYTEITSLQNETSNYDGEIVLCSERQCSTNTLNNKDLTPSENESDIYGMENISLQPCKECEMQIDTSLSDVPETQIISICSLCRDNSDSASIFKNVKNGKLVSIENKCILCNKDMSADNAYCKYEEKYSEVENDKIINLKQTNGTSDVHISQSFSCQDDKQTENSTFEIDTCDVNSSNKMPIIGGCAFKHANFSDSQRDNAKCTDAVPVTGAVSSQIENKRQDKKITSLSSCGKRNTALCSNKNGLVLISDRDIVGNLGVGCKSATMDQVTTNLEMGQDYDDASSNTDKSVFRTNKSEKMVNDFECNKGSLAAEQILSDWQNSDLCDWIPSQNISQIQVLKNCEINKGTSEPENSSGRFKRNDNLSRDNMDSVREGNNIENDANEMCSHDIKCGTVCDFNFEQIKETEILGHQVNTEQELTYVTLKDSFNTVESDGNVKTSTHDSVKPSIKSDKYFYNDNGEESCISTLLQNESCPRDYLVDETSLPNQLTCVFENVENINYHNDENSSPERDLRTMDAKQINTEHDLSLHASYKCTNISQNSRELDHTGLELIRYSESRECKQCPLNNEKSIEIVSNCAEEDINGTLPTENFEQNQLLRFNPDGFLSEVELKIYTTGKPSVLDVQEKQADCFDLGNDSGSLFSQQTITDGLIMTTSEISTSDPGQNLTSQDKENLFNTGNISRNIGRNISISDTDNLTQKHCNEFKHSNNSSFCSVPKLSECICEMYPNLKSKNKKCSELSNEKEINHEDIKRSNVTQNANLNTCSLNMKLNDSACLFQSYKHSDRDAINVSSECLYCTDLSQTSENISNSYSKKLHSRDDLNQVNSAEHGSLKNTGNKLCTGSIPCDGNKEQISTHINWGKSTEYQDLSDLSSLFDDCEDIDSRGTMSRDNTRVATVSTELSSELSAELTDSKTLKTLNPCSYQDGFEDKPSGELSAVKITTQKSSCNLVFSEKSSEPKDLMLRYEHKNSTGHKKFYSCKDELDTGIASAQEENNFRNLAAIRDEDINCEIKLNNLNLETPSHCDSSSLESEQLKTKVNSKGIQGQGFETEPKSCATGGAKLFELHTGLLSGHYSSEQDNCFGLSNKEGIEIGTKLSHDEDVFSEDNGLSSANPEHGSDKDYRHHQNVENGFLQENSIKKDTCQTEGDVNGILTLHNEESISNFNLPEKSENSLSGTAYTGNKNEIQTQIKDNLCEELCVRKSSEPGCISELQSPPEKGTVTNVSISYNDISDTSVARISNSSDLNTTRDFKFPEKVKDLEFCENKQPDNSINENTSSLDEILSDTSEAFIDAEDRLISPFTDKINTVCDKNSVANSKDLNISCGASTSTESFVDAVESLDDDYLTSTNFRHSNEFKNEETLSQTSSSVDDSSTSIAGSMDDLSGWEEFSENIVDINDYNGDMEAKRLGMTNNDRNSQYTLPDGQAHAAVCITKRVLHDKSYQSPSPTSESTETYLSKIKTNSLRYKDMRYGADQKVIGSSIFETGNGGTLKDIDVKGVRTETRACSNTKSKDADHYGQDHGSATILHGATITQPGSSGIGKSETHIPTTAVDSKIETAVIKRTQRRRRRQIGQQKVSITSDCVNEHISEIKLINSKQGDKAHDNESIEKSSGSHSEHSIYSCTVSDNMTFNNKLASGTKELSQQVSTNLNLNEFNLDRSTNSGTPLNSGYDDYVTKEVSSGRDKVDTAECTFTDRKNEIILTTSAIELDETRKFKTSDNESNKPGENNDDNAICQKDATIDGEYATKNDTINDVQLTVELEENIQRKDVDFDDIEFIDADDTTIDETEIEHNALKETGPLEENENESKQEKQISPNVSFTFSFGVDCTEVGIDANNGISTRDSKEHLIPGVQTVNSVDTKVSTCALEENQSQNQEQQLDLAGGGVKEDNVILEESEVTCEINILTTKSNIDNGQTDIGNCQDNEEAVLNDLKASTPVDQLQESQQYSAEISMQADICEESNISVRHALELERQKLADDDESRSRKSLFISKRSGRRATIETCSLENKEEDETGSETSIGNETTAKPAIKKSKSFRIDRKQISPMASFMNPPELPDASDNKDTLEPINKKVSDICKSFMTKTKASAQRTRAKNLSRSPAPQRKLMKWVNNQGKWMRIPIDDTQDNTDYTKDSQSPTESLQKPVHSENCINATVESPDNTILKADNDKCDENRLLDKQYTPPAERETHVSNDGLETNSKEDALDTDISKIIKSINKQEELICKSPDAIQTKNETTESQLIMKCNNVTNELICVEKGDSNNENKSHDIDVKSSSGIVLDTNESDGGNASKPNADQKVDVTRHMEIPQTRSDLHSTLKPFSNTGEHIPINEITDPTTTDTSSEPCSTDPDAEIEMKVIGTTLDDAQCGQEKHLKRQELLFGLLDSYNRRKPRRFTHHESYKNVQNALKSQCQNVDVNIVENACTGSTTIEKSANMTDNPKCIPKIKAVKIQEEVFECKTEYLKDTNISQSSKCDISFPSTENNESKVSQEQILSEKGIDFKAMKLPIRKSKTFSGLGDIERQKHVTHRTSDNTSVPCKPTVSPTVIVQTGNYSVKTESDKNALHYKNDTTAVPSVSRMSDKRSKAGLKLNLDKTQTRGRNDLQSDRSPSRLGPDHCRGRSSGDRSPNRLCVDQPRVRLRSPEKGPRQIPRSKLLSEIVEVEENKDDVSVTCDRRQQQQYYSDRQRQEGPKPVRRSNKRRSLSLPTGTLAFGDARIVYKNGHFTIETMDNSEYDSSQPADYHSSSRHLDSHVGDMWDMPDTSGNYSRVKSDSREVTDMHNKPHMRRQNAKTVLQSSDSTEDVFYSETEYVENVSPYKSNLNGDSKVLNMGRTSEEVFNESCSSRTSDMSVDSYSSERMDLSTDDSLTDAQKLSSSSLPDAKEDDVKRVIQRAKRTSSFRAAQEGGSLRLSGIEEDKVHNSTRARSVSLDDSQNSDLKNSPKIQNVQNQNPTFLKKVMGRRKTLNENLNISGFSKQSESAKDFFTKKMTLKGLFRKNKSDTSVNSPLKTEHPVSPPIAAFQDDDIGSFDTPPGSPYRSRDLRRRHTSADILKSYPDSSETDSNCPTPTQERSNISRHSISSPSTPSHEANSFLNLSPHSAPHFRDDDEMSITSASSYASSIHSPPLEQPHKPKTPKPVGASPRRNASVGSQLSRSGSQSSQRNVMNSVTSLESDQYESLQDDTIRDPRCECSYKSDEIKHRTSNRNVRGSSGSLNMCQFCKQMEFYKIDSAFSSSSFHKQQLLSKEKVSDDSTRLRKDSSGRINYERLGIISQADVASSNSNDSGIQRDASVHSSNESIKGTSESRIRLRRNKSLSPHPDRPKSEISVRWADGDSGDYDITETPVKLRNKSPRDRPRPKSDLDGSSFLSQRMKAFGSDINLQPYCSLRSLYEMKRQDLDRQKNRRMSTPHPIKSRLQRVPQKLHKQPPLVRSSSMPESLEKIHKRRKMHHLLDFHLDSLSRHMDIDTLSDESDLSFDQASLQERSVSIQSSSSQLTAMDEDEDNLTYAEALWDHITMDPEELGFRAQDVIEVLDMADKDWWFGVIDDREGWFPATFVRIRVNQDQLDDDLDLDSTIQDNLTTSPKLRRISMFNKNQARSNVVNEIINAEREYVKHLKDVVEGYIQHARKRTEMFPEERILLIFGNIEKIYSFAQKFVSQLEMCIDVCPHLSEIGQCFLDNERGFEIYSDYCNNHPSACEELDELCKDSKYKHFFEACRLLQELVEIPLEGFLLTPVQKICKYPLQLAELLKYTPPDHPDYMMVKDALAAMRKIATLINERKRKMESIEKIAVWQHSVVDWEGPDLLEGSSELILSGELNKINTAGWSQERFFFLFDHQVVYCKKELLKRHVFSYKGRIDLDHCDIVDIPDGKDSQYNVTVKHAWKFHETHRDKWYLVYAKSEAVKQSWLKAIRDERQRVLEDQENDFCVPDHWKQTVLNKVRSQSHLKDKQSGGRTSHGQIMSQKDLKDFTYATLPRHRISQKHDKKKGWFKFGGGKKSKR
ncbi:uncharacterized protein LOC123554283 isoform X2 [Mercenaria mercenaria]|uniref:uncharacterized protein LOC123554283 isoform X2 n=1 Tax=Mercenaria mercenaria TaxID=6596 RepID=UPI00234E8607|nr:uncharacterized protein LOC123554283 isoform X2 [Mercenaria mercenaria]